MCHRFTVTAQGSGRKTKERWRKQEVIVGERRKDSLLKGTIPAERGQRIRGPTLRSELVVTEQSTHWLTAALGAGKGEWGVRCVGQG